MDSDKKKHSTPPPDDCEIRCRRLGGQVTFGYCRREAMGKPCFKAVDCWYQTFDAEAFFRKELGDDLFEEVFMAPPKPRMVTLVELIAQATQTLKKESKSQQ